jgi:transposase-like protein
MRCPAPNCGREFESKRVGGHVKKFRCAACKHAFEKHARTVGEKVLAITTASRATGNEACD